MAFTIRRCHPHIFFITLITLITNFILTISILTTTTRLGMCPPRRIRLRRRLPLQRPSLPEEEEEEVVVVMVQVLVPWALVHPITPKITSEEEDVVPAITTTTTTRTSFTTSSSSSITTNISRRSRRM